MRLLVVLLALSSGCTLARSTLGSSAMDGAIERDGGGGAIDAPIDSSGDARPGDAGPDARPDDAGTDACVVLSATDPCGGGDENCNGSVDEDCACPPSTMRPCGTCADGTETCSAAGAWGACVGASTPPTYYADSDADGAGDLSMPMASCMPVAGYVLDATDCDDACGACTPGRTEICDDLDNDCDGVRDNGIVRPTWYRDADGDGFGDPAMSMSPCTAPGAGWVLNNTDCNDACTRCRPDFPDELCGDAADNDCDGGVDTGCDCDIFTTAGRTYIYCPIPQNWATARTRCTTLGGDLVSLETRAENTAVWAAVDMYDVYVWTGGNDSATEGTWMWTSGAAVGACSGTTAPCNWESGQPNGGSSDDCIVLREDWAGRWGDVSCTASSYPYVCELP